MGRAPQRPETQTLFFIQRGDASSVPVFVNFRIFSGAGQKEPNLDFRHFPSTSVTCGVVTIPQPVIFCQSFVNFPSNSVTLPSHLLLFRHILSEIRHFFPVYIHETFSQDGEMFCLTMDHEDVVIHLSSAGPPSPAQRVPLGTRRAIAMAAVRVADPALANGRSSNLLQFVGQHRE